LTSYLTCEGKITYENADIIFRDISKLEEEQFKLNYLKAQRMKEN
jgi:5'-3' exonuclease